MENQRHFLVAERISGTVVMVDGDKLADAQRQVAAELGHPVAFTVVDLPMAWMHFKGLVGDKTRFSTLEAAEIAGVSAYAMSLWLRAGIARAGYCGRPKGQRGRQRHFTVWAAFVAGVAGSLQRAGCNRKTLKAAARLLFEGSELFEAAAARA